MAADVTIESPHPDVPALEDGMTKNSSVTFLTAGTAVSAKYRGAYCEAMVDQVVIRFKLRVQLKNSKNVISVDQNDVVSGDPALGSEVTVRMPASADGARSSGSSVVERVGTVIRVADTSLYTVVFDDGDKRTLRRTQLVIKGERHFKESESLDCLPLTNPEQFRQPVIDKKKLRLEDNDTDDDDQEDIVLDALETDLSHTASVSHALGKIEDPPTSSVKNAPTLSAPSICTQPLGDASQNAIDHSLNNPSAEESPKFDMNPDIARHRLLGRLVLVDMPVSSKDNLSSSGVAGDSSIMSNSSSGTTDVSSKRRFTPGLVVLPSAMPGIDLRPTSGLLGKSSKVPMLLVRSFKDNRFMPVPLCYMKRLKRPNAVELAHTYPSLRAAFERALLWLDCYELPASWGENATQNLLGTKDWRSARRLYRAKVSANSHSSKSKQNNAASVDSTASSSGDEKITNQAHLSAHRKASTPKRLLTSKATSIVVRKRAFASITKSRNIKKAKAKSVIKKRRSRSLDSQRGSMRKASTTSERRLSKMKERSPLSGDRCKSASSDDSVASGSSAETTSITSQSGSSTVYSSSSDSESASSSSVDFEARDRWIAQLYRFMDEGGAPINKAPSLANKDLDLYKLYKLVRQNGGFHRVTAQLKWGYIYSKLGLPHNFSAGPRNLQAAFKRYLYPLDDISRKLGTDLDALPLSRPRNSSAYCSSFATATPRSTAISSRTASAVTAPKAMLAEPKQVDKSPTGKPVLTANDASAERAVEPVIESSPPVLSPPVLGHTPSPCNEWSSSPIDSTPIHGTARTCKDSHLKVDADEVSESLHQSSRKPKDVGDFTSIKSIAQSVDQSMAEIVKISDTASVRSSLSSVSLSSAESAHSKSHKRDSSTSSRPQPLFLPFPNEHNDEIERVQSNRVIPIGSRVRVRCGDRVAYEARVIKHIRPQPEISTCLINAQAKFNSWSNPSELQYRVHYMGWNTRHDEVVSRSRIISVIQWGHSVGSDRPPSCSSLNLAIEHSQRQKSTNHIKPMKSNSSNSVRRCSGAPDSEQSQMSLKFPTDELEYEDQSDHSQNAETASDIVTTTAPVVRRRRLVFGPNADSAHQRKRPRIQDPSAIPHKSESEKSDKLSQLGDSKRLGLKREGHFPISLKMEPGVVGDSATLVSTSESLEQQTRASLSVPPTSKRPRICEISDISDEAEKEVPRKPMEKVSVKEHSSKFKGSLPRSKSSTISKVDPKQQRSAEGEPKKNHRNQRRSEKTEAATPKSSNTKSFKLQPKMSQLSIPTPEKNVKSNDTPKSTVTKTVIQKPSNTQAVPSKSLAEKPIAKKSKPSDSRQQLDAEGKSTLSAKKNMPKLADVRKEIQSPQEITSKQDVVDSRSADVKSKASTSSNGGGKNSSANRDIATSKTEKAVSWIRSSKSAPRDAWPTTVSKGKTDEEQPAASKGVANPRKKKLAVTINDNQSSSDDNQEIRDAISEKKASKTHDPTLPSHSNKKVPSSHSKDSLISEGSDDQPKGQKDKSKRSQAKQSNRASVERKPTVASGKRPFITSPPSTSGEEESSESDYGTIDALPRLTRNQHRQLLGDTPPGALLLTASPVGLITNAPNTHSVKMEPAPKVVDKTSTGLPVAEALPTPIKSACVSTEPTVNPALVSTVDNCITDAAASVLGFDNAVDLHTKTECSADRTGESIGEPRSAVNLRDGQRSTENGDNVQSVKVEEKDHVDEDEDESGSVRTLSTEPMKEVQFDFNMSPSEDSLAVSSALSDDSNGVVEKDRSSTSRKEVAASPNAFSDTTEASSHSPSEDQVRKSGTTRKRGRDDNGSQTTESESHQKHKSASRSVRTRHVSSNSGTARKSGKRASATHRPVTSDRSPTPVSDSPHCARSPTATGTSLSASQPTSTPNKPSTTPAHPRLDPSQRRFGGPFFPIPGFDEMSSEMKCLYLQDRMHRILEAWRSAKQFLKDLDHRTNRARRLRSRHVASESQPALGTKAVAEEQGASNQADGALDRPPTLHFS